MMEDTWLSIEDDSDSNFIDSDAVDSETEAELYSVIHYEQNLHNLNCPTTEVKNVHSSDETKNVSFAEESRQFVMAKSICSRNTIFENGDERSTFDTFNHETVFLNKVSQKLNLVKKAIPGSNDNCNNSYSQNSEDLYTNQTVKGVLSNNKRKANFDSSISLNSMKKNCTGSNYSSDSDSDSIIWTEVDASDKGEFQTNLHEDDDVIYLSSESESESRFHCLPPAKQSERNLKNTSMPNIKIGENIKDVWFVNEADLHRPKRRNTRRYHDNIEINCTNCLRKGHNSRICPFPKTIKCFICGDVGHPGSICTNRICAKCFSVGHDSKYCWKPPYIKYCMLCSMKGHIKENCPDLWRRYHLTTSPGKIVRGKNIKGVSLLYCWNCGQGGHIGTVCTESRGPKYCLSTWPCVISYDDPEDLLNERLNDYSNRRNSFKNSSKRTTVSKEQFQNNNNNSFKRKTHLNQMNAAVGANFNSEKKIKKKKKKLNQQWNKLKKSLRDKNFPRTPKNNKSSPPDDPLPEAVNKMITKKKNRRERNRKRRLKQRMKLLAERNVIQIVPVSFTPVKSEDA